MDRLKECIYSTSLLMGYTSICHGPHHLAVIYNPTYLLMLSSKKLFMRPLFWTVERFKEWLIFTSLFRKKATQMYCKKNRTSRWRFSLLPLTPTNKKISNCVTMRGREGKREGGGREGGWEGGKERKERRKEGKEKGSLQQANVFKALTEIEGFEYRITGVSNQVRCQQRLAEL